MYENLLNGYKTELEELSKNLDNVRNQIMQLEQHGHQLVAQGNILTGKIAALEEVLSIEKVAKEEGIENV